MRRTTGPNYSDEFKMEVLECAKSSGSVLAASIKYHVTAGTVYSWNRIFKVFDTLDYTEDDKIEILEFSAVHGISEAHDKFGVAKVTIMNWAELNPGIIEFRKNRKIPPEMKIEILEYAAKNNEDHHGMHIAAAHYGYDVRVLREWNSDPRFHRVEMLEPRRKSRYSDEEKRSILEQVAAKGWELGTKEAPVSASTLFKWNKKLRVIPPDEALSRPEELKKSIAEAAKSRSIHDVSVTHCIPVGTVWSWIDKYGGGGKQPVCSAIIRDVFNAARSN